MSDQQLDQNQQAITREHVRQLFAAKAGPDRKIRGMTEDEYFNALVQVQRQRQAEVSELSDDDLITPEPTASASAANGPAHAGGDPAAHFASLDRSYRGWLSTARAGDETAWAQAAPFLNEMRKEDIDSRLAELTTGEIEKLRQGAIHKGGVGAGAPLVQRCAVALQARTAPPRPVSPSTETPQHAYEQGVFAAWNNAEPVLTPNEDSRELATQFFAGYESVLNKMDAGEDKPGRSGGGKEEADNGTGGLKTVGGHIADEVIPKVAEHHFGLKIPEVPYVGLIEMATELQSDTPMVNPDELTPAERIKRNREWAKGARRQLNEFRAYYDAKHPQ